MRWNERGYSLIEMILVFLVVGIMAFVAIPAIQSTQRVSMDGAARKMEGDIQFAQSLAITTSEAHGFRTTGGAGGTTYEIYKVSDNRVVTSPYDHMPMSEDFTESYSGITFVGSHDIRFDSLGNPTFVSGGNTITIQNTDNETKNIVVSASGLIDIQ